jgi:hypothetical protein
MSELFCKSCKSGDLLSPYRPYEVIDRCDYWHTARCPRVKKKVTKRIVFHPNPKTIGELRLALAGYEDALELERPLQVIIVDRKKGACKMILKHKPFPSYLDKL